MLFRSGAYTYLMAKQMMDIAGLSFIQIDAGRIGGISSAYEIARYAEAHGATYVNHTFTTPLALSASLQPYAGLKDAVLCEYPVEATPLAAALTLETLPVDGDGRVHLPERPGLGMTPNPATIRQYLQPVEIRVGDQRLHTTPAI